jgi:hypothetical protein
MKKVYSNSIAPMIYGTVFIIFVGAIMYFKEFAIGTPFIVMGIGLIYSVALLLPSFPLFAYDENGLKINRLLEGSFNLLFPKFYFKWDEVISIRNGLGGYRVTFKSETVLDGAFVIINSTLVDHLKVISDIVRYVQENNPNATIDPFILKRLEESHSDLFKVCPQCGRVMEKEMKFCGKCGTHLNPSKEL